MPMPRQKPGRSKQDYGTPWPLIHAIEARWGELAIDLAARVDNAKAPLFITPEEDSLTQDWGKRIGNGLAFLNPEFDDIGPWAAKCAGWLAGQDKRRESLSEDKQSHSFTYDNFSHDLSPLGPEAQSGYVQGRGAKVKGMAGNNAGDFCYAQGDEGAEFCGDPKSQHCRVIGSADFWKSTKGLEHLVKCMRDHHLIHHRFVADPPTPNAQCPAPFLHGGIIKLVPASIGSEWFADNCEGKSKVVGLRPRIKFYGCHVLFKDGSLKGQRKCLLTNPDCLGCASYPKDCMLTLWGSRFKAEPIFQTWRWDAESVMGAVATGLREAAAA